jgi:drug/metabolite transporter (DMT)-like permease
LLFGVAQATYFRRAVHKPTQRLKAIQMLVWCCVLWGVSFPTTRALALVQQQLVPEASSWFLAAELIVWRFGLAAVILAVLSARTLGQLTRTELWHGLGLGLFGGGGLLLQVDGLAHTHASVSAFLTQCYCLFIPLWVSIWGRRWPSVRILIACALVATGVAVLAEVKWGDFRLGRGEIETLLASVLFGGQILWLERPRFAGTNVNRFSVVMFSVMALLALPVAVATTPQPAAWLRAYSTAATVGMLGILVVVCTFGGYMLMNRWQRYVTATEAGLIYCSEPIFAAVWALFLPSWLSAWAGIHYANERLTTSLLVGGGLITAANLLVQWPQAGSKHRQVTGMAQSRCPQQAPMPTARP